MEIVQGRSGGGAPSLLRTLKQYVDASQDISKSIDEVGEIKILASGFISMSMDPCMGIQRLTNKHMQRVMSRPPLRQCLRSCQLATRSRPFQHFSNL